MNSNYNERKSFYTLLVSSLFFPIHEYLKCHNSVSVRKQLEISQWWPRQQIEQFQFTRLRRLLFYAQANVPYYHGLFAEIGFNPTEINSLADLKHLPLLDKAKIRNNIDAFKSIKAQKLARFNTGGSSGEPLVFYIGNERISHDVAAKWRATRWWDVDIGDPEIVVWGSPIELDAQDSIRVLRDRLFRSKLLPAFEMSEQKLNIFLKEIQSQRPRMLFGYPSALAHIAGHAEKIGMQMDNLGIRVAFVTSERLYDDQRQQISKVFGCSVANGYGGRDAGFIAHECPVGNMHITAEDIIVEITDHHGIPLPPGQSGEIVITHLASSDFPFIRYRTGDIGSLDDKLCSCGRGLPLLREIQGRSTDFVMAQNGTVMHGLALIYILRNLPQISAFKIIQESLNLTRVWVVSEIGLDPTISEMIKHKFQSRLGQNVEIIIEEVAEIPKEKSGKFRYVMSKVSPN
ncbi:phenylacetate--CoA ligase family protein [Nitrosomonas sp. Nm132]|jgi:phenylacetate-CoA ligase|uniref:phenylacetate--CoA ligase family protein n=1 Tax=Nitrosomonas sp. Nm132 TaxID=1881053 RepID=UPI00088993A0|nr:AMP-binding protein [Nitrosomonas sp. Nm132]SDH55166.1 phenylacetate-CoA ligase [Nitrosomonas sp. Nm132]